MRTSRQPRGLRRWALEVAAALLLALPLGSTPGPATGQDWGVHSGDKNAQVLERLLGLLEKDPHNAYVFQRALTQAASSGGVEALVERYQQALAQHPDDIATLVILARLYDQQGDYELSLRYLDDAYSRGEQSWQLLSARAAARSELGDQEGAEADLEAALASAHSKSDRIDALRRLGDLARRGGREEDALAAYLRIVEVDPKDKFLRWELAGLFYEQERWDEAVAQYEAAASLAGRNVEERSRAELEIAELAEKTGRYDDAIARYEAIQDRTKPSHWLHREAQLRMVAVYRAKGDMEGLLALIERRLKGDRRDTWALAEKAELLLELDRLDEASEAYAAYMAAERTPNPDTFASYVNVLRRQGRQDAIVKLYEARMRGEKDQARRLDLGLELVATLKEGAEVPLEAYTRLRELEDAFKGPDAMIKLAEAYARLGGSRDVQARANVLLDKVMEESPGRMEPYVILLRIAAERGDEPGERALLERVAQLAALDAAMVRRLVVFYEERGQTERVRQVIELAGEKLPDDLEILFLRAAYVGATPAGADATYGLASNDVALQTWRRIVTQSDTDEHLTLGFESYIVLLRQLDIVDHEIRRTEREMTAQPSAWRLGRRLFVLYVAAGRLDDALQLGSMVQPFLDGGRPLEELGLTAIDEESVDDGVLLLDRLARRSPPRAWLYSLRAADLLARQDRTRAALRRVEEALEHAPSSPDAYARAAEVLLRLNELGEAAEAIEEAITLAPKQAAYRLVHAQILRDRWRQEYTEELSDAAFEAVLEGLAVANTAVQAEDLLALFDGLVSDTGLDPSVMARRLEAVADRVAQRPIADMIRAHARG